MLKCVDTANFYVCKWTIKKRKLWQKSRFLYYWRTVKAYLPRPNFMLPFVNNKWFHFAFHLLTWIKPSTLLNTMLQALVLSLYFSNVLHCFNLLDQAKSLTYIYVSGSSISKSSSSRIKKIIRLYSIKALTKECNNVYKILYHQGFHYFQKIQKYQGYQAF